MSGFKPDGSQGGSPTIKESGVAAGTRQGINFIEGANITITLADDAVNNEVDVTIAAGGGGAAIDIKEEGGAAMTVSSIDFVGSMTTASAVGAAGTLTTAHGTQAGGTTHPDAVAGGASGFMSGTDKTKLNGIASGATNGISTQDEGVAAGSNQTTLNFVGAGVSASSVGSTTTVTVAGTGVSDGDKGDITVSGSGATWTIDNDVVTYAKMQNISATDRLLGRDTAAAGDTEELTVSGGLEFTGTGGIQRSALTGDVTASAGSNATTIANNAVTTAKILDANVTLAKLANIATDRLIGRDTAASGVPEELTVGGGLEFSGTGGIQRSALTGDVTASAGSNSTTIANNAVTTAKILDANVTLAKLANIGTDRLIGRDTAASGVPEELTVGGGLEFSGVGGIQRSALTGDVTASAGSNSTTIANNAVTTAKVLDANITLAKLANIGTDRLIGRDTAASGVPEELTVSGGLEFTGSTGIQRSALTGDVTASAGSNSTTIANDAVTYAKMQNVSATSRFIGRITAGAGDPEELTGTQATSLLDNVVGDSGSGGTKGLVPAPAAGDAAANKFLKANGTWATATGSGSVATDTIFDAKGDLPVGTGADTASRLAVGTNGQVLTADSTQSTGVKWATPSSGSVATDTIWDTKGDLVAATGADAATKVAVGSNGQILTADSTASNGVAWADKFNMRTTSELFEEFVGNDISGSLNWGSQSNSGSLTVDLTSVNTANHWGTVDISTSTSASSQPLLLLQIDSLIFSAAFQFEYTFRTPANLSDATNRYILYVGTSNSANGVPNQGITVQYSDNVNSGNWYIVAADGGGSTTTNSGSAVAANTWYTVKLVGNSGYTSVEAFVATDGGSYTSLGTVAANLPAGRCGPIFYLRKTAGTTARVMVADAWYGRKTIAR